MDPSLAHGRRDFDMIQIIPKVLYNFVRANILRNELMSESFRK